jgi:uncharacterized protein (DUF1697 family)
VADTCIALLRGINVGTAKRVGMAELRALVQGLGFGDVRTLLNSGNVVFSAPKAKTGGAAGRIQKAIETKLGVTARVMVVSAEELAEVVAANPLLEIADNPSRLMVAILGEAADRAKLADVLKKDWAGERIALGPGRSFYMWAPQGVIESKLNAAVSKALRDGVTTRNWATVLKLNAMAGSPGQ